VKVLTFLGCIFVLMTFLAIVAEAESVEASIDQKCNAQPGIIVVPEGNTAKNFAFNNLKAGTSCEPGGITSLYKGWCIQKEDGTDIYCYNETDGVSSQLPNPLSTLTLGPGRYRVTVGGGMGAHVVVTYNISGPKTTPGEANTLKSEIDESCTRQPAILVVPQGNTAYNFQLKGLSAGSNCHTLQTIMDQHWDISRQDGTKVYEYRRDSGKDPEEPYGALRSISIGPGRYSINVAGGMGAYVTVTYQLVKPIGKGQPKEVRCEIKNVGGTPIPEGCQFSIAPGFTAMNFKRLGFDRGSGSFDHDAWKIKNGSTGKDVYSYFYREGESPVESLGKLSDLSLPAGDYSITLDGGVGAYVSFSYELVGLGSQVNQIPGILALTPDQLGPRPSGSTVTWKASAKDPDGDPIYYRFMLKGPSTSDQWIEKRGWSTDSIWTWTTNEKDTGNNQVEVWVRDGKHNGSISYDNRSLANFIIRTLSGVSIIDFESKESWYTDTKNQDENWGRYFIDNGKVTASSKINDAPGHTDSSFHSDPRYAIFRFDGSIRGNVITGTSSIEWPPSRTISYNEHGSIDCEKYSSELSRSKDVITLNPDHTWKSSGVMIECFTTDNIISGENCGETLGVHNETCPVMEREQGKEYTSSGTWKLVSGSPIAAG